MTSPLLGNDGAHLSSSPKGNEHEFCNASTRERSDVADLERHLQADRISWQEAHELPPLPHLDARSKSFTDAQEASRADVVAESRQLRQPGGFRRAHLVEVAHLQGSATQMQSVVERPTLVQQLRSLGDSFANSIDDVWIYEAQFGRDDCEIPIQMPNAHDGHIRAHKLSNIGVVISLIKGNMGAGVLFQPSAFKAGGYALMSVMLASLALTALFCSLHLAEIRGLKKNCSYGDMMLEVRGRPGLLCVNTSIFLLEVGTCCSYMGLIAKTVQQVLLPKVPIWALLFGSLVIFVPVALIRKVSKLAPLSFLGVMLTFLAVVSVVWFEVETLCESGIPWGQVQPVKANGTLVALGIACFTFEGVATLLPIYDAAEHPRRFALMYACALSFVSLSNIMIGLFGYLAFGEETRDVILLNLPRGIAIQIVQLAFLVAVFCTFPLALLPALRIVEDGLFGLPISNPPFANKCKKNVFRTVFVIAMAVITVAGSSSLEHFVSIVGAFCGLPLAFVYPAIIHCGLHPTLGSVGRFIDWMIIVVGIGLTFSITIYSFATWGNS